MKVSNEFKIGLLIVLSIVLFYWGYAYLKGEGLFKKGYFLYAKFSAAKGLQPSNPVMINGFRAGSVYAISAANDLKEILVEIKLKQPFEIPVNSIATIEASPLGTSTLNITLGNAVKKLQSGDTLQAIYSEELLGKMGAQILPLADQAKLTLKSADMLVNNLNKILDPNTIHHTQLAVENIAKTTEQVYLLISQMQKVLNAQAENLQSTIQNVHSFSTTLTKVEDKLFPTLSNVEQITQKLNNTPIDKTLQEVQSSVHTLNRILEKLNSSNSTVGALLNDKKMYSQLNQTLSSLNILLDDMRANPKRYMHFSIFGKNKSGDYLTKPLTDTIH